MSAIIARLVPTEESPKATITPAQAKKRMPRRALINLARASVLVGGVGLAIVIPLGWGSGSPA